MLKASVITRALHTRYAALAMGCVALVAACIFMLVEPNRQFEEAGALVRGWNVLDHLSRGRSFAAALVGNALVALMMILINRRFNIIRTMTALFAGLYLIIAVATPGVFCHFGRGLMLCLAVLAAVGIIYDVYDSPTAPWGVFGVFLILSAGAALCYSFIIYIPVFVVACAQMRVFNLRTMLAALMGTATPWWILLGFGVVQPADLVMPDPVSIFRQINLSTALHLTVSAGVSAFLCILAIVLNMMKTIAYNAHTRAVNGVMLILSVVTIIAGCIDYGMLQVYIPLLDCCAAMQISHFFATRKVDRMYVAIFSIIAIYILLYVWRIAL